jgi:pullulanase/glycogen debranching enzyme
MLSRAPACRARHDDYTGSETTMRETFLARLAGSFRHLGAWLVLLCVAALAACGGGNTTNISNAPNPLAVGDSSDLKVVLSAVPAGGGGGGGGGSTVRLYYNRPDNNYAGWTVYVYNGPGEVLGGWPGKGPDGEEAGAGKYWDIAVGGASFNFIIVKDGGGTREPSGWSGANNDQQQFWSVADGKTIYKVAGDRTNYTSNPAGAATPDIDTVRVHYKRFDGQYQNWGIHIWPTSGLDTARVPAGVVIDSWPNPVPFASWPGYAAGAGEVVFDIPVLNPQGDASRTNLQFIIHGIPPGASLDDKDGRNDNIQVNYAALKINNKVGEIWLIQGDPTVYTSFPDTRQVSSRDARAYWLTRDLLQYPKIDNSGVFKLYHSATGQIKVEKDKAVTGADGSITLDVFGGTVPSAAATRFKYVPAGVVLQVKAADRAMLPTLHKSQLVLVQENAGGLTQNASTAQVAGALDDLYAAAESEGDLGAKPGAAGTTFKLWAPTAQKVTVAVYDSANGLTTQLLPAAFDAATGMWSASTGGDLSGKYYRYVVEVFVRGVGLVRQLVTDPYSVSLSTDSQRSYIADLDSPALKPAGWDGHAVPNKVAAQTDMSIYELHVRDFSANDFTVSAVNRGKYLAFTEFGSAGMQHLRALADAGLTDVHFLPIFDLATVPETNCRAVATGGAADGTDQQAAVNAARDADCFNWGYDPFHFNAPEGSYASSAGDGARRIVEMRAMVQALHSIGLRVGMDVVYNHTTASGQNDKSVLDRVVPGYYHRLSGVGEVEKSTCCDNTATENTMMAKLMIDSAVLFVKHYKIDSFRFDLMGHQPRAVMEKLQAAVDAAAGKRVNLIGEGWNFGEVESGQRFVQASQLSLNGSGIGTFSDRARDYVRGGGPFDSGDSLIANQGFINGLHYDPNAKGAGRSKNDLMWAADVIKVGLAGSIRGFTLTTHWDATLRLEEINYNGQPAGYVLEPGEVVNYVENHDNQTLFDNNAYKLPLATSKEDRARVQILGAAINAFSQGVAYYHAGVDTLRSKSLDRNSYNSGDHFNRIDWSYQDNYFGTGLPPEGDNGSNWPQIRSILAQTGAIKPGAGEIGWTRDAFRDLLRIRASSTLFRLRTGDDIKARLRFHNTGSAQVPTVLMAQIDGNGYAGAGFKEVVYLVNVDKTAQTVTVDALKGKAYTLHPVHSAAGAADKRAATATYLAASGAFTVPARTAVVFVLN